MNGAHWHLALNHLPIIIPMVGLLVMIGGLLFRSETVKMVAYSIFILGALTAVVASYTGEGAEEVVEALAGVDERFMNIHEEAAEMFAILLYVLGGIALVGLWTSWKRKSYSNYIAFVAIALAVVGLFYAMETGTTGGEIRHSEIRAGGTGNGQNALPTSEEEEHD